MKNHRVKKYSRGEQLFDIACGILILPALWLLVCGVFVL